MLSEVLVLNATVHTFPRGSKYLMTKEVGSKAIIWFRALNPE